jgi:hypothetical protein
MHVLLLSTWSQFLHHSRSRPSEVAVPGYSRYAPTVSRYQTIPNSRVLQHKSFRISRSPARKLADHIILPVILMDLSRLGDWFAHTPTKLSTCDLLPGIFPAVHQDGVCGKKVRCAILSTASIHFASASALGVMDRMGGWADSRREIRDVTKSAWTSIIVGPLTSAVGAEKWRNVVSEVL